MKLTVIVVEYRVFREGESILFGSQYKHEPLITKYKNSFLFDFINRLKVYLVYPWFLKKNLRAYGVYGVYPM